MSARSGRPGGAASALLGMLGVAVVAGLMITVGVAPAIALTGVSAKNGIGLFENLPDDLKIVDLQQKTEIFANSNGKPVQIASFYNQNRDVIPWSDVPVTVKNATLAAEDVRFYSHGGVDPTGILRAVVSDIGGGSQGASTITQQYVKNVCIQEAELLPKQSQVNAAYAECTGGISRKLKEARLAIGLEKKYSKDQILLGYLNIAGFGGRIYGIESAAQYYFGVHAKDLSVAQAASLMAIVNAPNSLRIDVKANLAANTVRRDYILATELKHHLITRAEYDTAMKTTVKPVITPTHSGCAQAKEAAYFCTYVVNTVLHNPVFGASEGERYNRLQSAGWRIYTTLDLDLEAKAKATMSTYVPAKSPAGTDLGAAAVTVQVGTGKVLSMVQSKSFDDSGAKSTKGPGYTATAVNYNVDHVDGGSTYGFQPGSTYKLFTLLDWLKNGHGVYEKVSGAQRTLPAGALQACGRPAAAWSVHNDVAGEGGMQTVYQATAGSVNGAFASMGEQLDLCDIQKQAQVMGVHRGDGGPVGNNPSSILGTDTIAPLTMATAYAGIANQGATCSPIVIEKILTTDGKQVTVPASDCKQSVPKNIAIAAGYTLHGVFGGTAAGDQGALNGAFGMVKTGTTDNAEQTWEVGGSTGTTTAVWVGNINGNTNLRTVYGFPGCGAQAANVRHCLWQGIQAANEAKYPGSPSWPTPDPQFLYGQQVSVPNVAGLSTADATSTLQKAGFTVTTGKPQASATVPAGLVAATNPPSGTQAAPGSSVALLPSSGPAPAQPSPSPGAQQRQVPDVMGHRIDQASAEITAAGLTPRVTYFAGAGTDCTVGLQSPAGGSPAQDHQKVDLVVKGSEQQCRSH